MTKKMIIGLDFDGVIAYNPFRIIRMPISYIKRHFLGVHRLTFFKPKNEFQKIMWLIMHESSVFPGQGVKLLKEIAKRPDLEFHLITARYHFLDKQLVRWLRSNDLYNVFSTINLNQLDEQPHLFKERMVKEKKLDVFIEDNLDIVKHLSKTTSTKILWIYNILDRNYPYPQKFPFLQKALESVL